MTDHVDAPPELMPLQACDCCGVQVSRRRGSMWHGRDLICLPCFYIWYDDALVTRAEIKAIRLKRYGTDDTVECR